MCYSAGIRQGVNKIFTTSKAIYSTILKPIHLNQDSKDYKIHISEEIKSENLPILRLFFFFFIFH